MNPRRQDAKTADTIPLSVVERTLPTGHCKKARSNEPKSSLEGRCQVNVTEKSDLPY